MTEDLRKNPRAKVSGVRATYSHADEASATDDVRDVSRGGMYLATPTPLAVGKLVHIEIRVPGDPDALTATGRVVWTRDTADGADRPAGMGVKFVDVEEGAVEVIGRIVEETLAVPVPVQGAPQRERTVMGVGGSDPPPASASVNGMPVAGVPAREPTMLGVGADAPPLPEEPAAEAKKEPAPKKETPAPKKEAPAPAKKEAPAKAPEARSGNATWIFVLLVAAVVAFFLFRDQILGKDPPPAPPPPASTR